MKRLLPFLLLFINSQLFSQIFVNQNATGNNDGTSWEDAFTSLHVAISNANAGDEIWMAKGVYTTATTDRSISYEITKPLDIYGGFSGEKTKEDRVIDERTYLSGNIGDPSDTLDNAYHIFKITDFEGTVLIDGIEFDDAYAEGPNEEDKVGGAIYCQSKNLQLNNCWFKRNRAEESSSAIFYNPSVAGKLFILNSYFEENLAKNYEGIYVKTSGSKLMIESSEFTKHTRSQVMIRVDSSDVAIRNSAFYNNKNKSSGCVFLQGGEANKLTLISNEFYENTGSSNSLVFAYKTSVLVDSCSFHDNYIGNSGSLYISGGDSLIIKNTTFEDNTASGGYGPYSGSSIIEFSNVKFINNYSESSYASGYLYSDKLTIEDCLIENITSEGSNAGFYITVQDDFFLQNTIFKNLKASGNAAMYISSQKNVYIDSCQFLNNQVSGQAAVFYASVNDSLSVTNCVFDGNETSGSQIGCYYIYAKNHILKNSLFQNNKSNNQSGTFYNSGGRLLVDSCQFFNNSAKVNGGAFLSVGEYSEIKNSQFVGNRSDYSGGAIYLLSDSSLVQNCIFRNNYAELYGGALYAPRTKLISNCIFEGNGSKTNLFGGAIYSSIYNENSYFYGNIFKGNVSINGGAVYNSNGDDLNYKAYFVNNTIVDNVGIENRSGALHFENGAGVLKNNIIWNNGDSSVYSKPEAQVSYEQNIINGITSENNNIEQDPFLSGEYYPLAFSNAVDFGVEDEFHQQFPKDVYGNQRVQGNGVDLGAVETAYVSELITLKGKVLYDPEETCQQNENSIGLKGISIKATPGEFYTTTNSKGEFSFRLPIGNYELTQFLDEDELEEMSPICPKTGIKSGFEAINNGEIIDVGVFFNQVKTCERLDVQISSLRKRNCFESKTEVLVTNKSALPVTNRALKIKLSDKITVKNFTPTYQNRSENGDMLNFMISELTSQETFKLNIVDSVKCDPTANNLGDYVCVEAIINTQDNCTLVSPDWDGSTINVLGVCKEGGASFYLVNNSSSPMTSEEEYRVFLDDTLVFKGSFQIEPNDTAKITIYDNFEGIRVEADQTEGNPFNSVTYYNLGACNTNNTGDFIPLSDATNKVYGKAEKCTQITGSYDPNEIVVSPKGWGEAGNILKNQPLEYTIYFQNTGTDNAGRVMIIDTLSPYFDISTFNELPTSHNASLQIFGNNPAIAVWTLNGINLPDSTTDLAGSQGYVSFSVDLEQDVFETAEVLNKANIYFDYNLPITTNTVLNTVWANYPERLGEVVVEEEVVLSSEMASVDQTITVGPNPFRQSIFIKGIEGEANLKLFSAFGEILLNRKVQDGEEIVLPKKITGVVVYELQSKDYQLIKRGKLVSY